MAIKTISGIYANGYGLAAGYAGVSITPAGVVGGAPGALGAPNGKVGLVLPSGGVVDNDGHLNGGAGYSYASKTMGRTGGGGGAALELAALGSVVNSETIVGGAGGAGDPGNYVANPDGPPYGVSGPGGAAGVGVNLDAGGDLINLGLIAGGQGGEGGRSKSGGQGGAGVLLQAGGSIDNLDVVNGGAGGATLYYPLSHSGPGGVGVYSVSGGTLTNSGLIDGGDGSPFVGTGFFANAAVAFESGGQVSNTGTISAAPDGAAVLFKSGGSLANSGVIDGGADLSADFAGSGGDAVVLYSGASLTNRGAIVGGGDTTGRGGDGVLLFEAGSQITNSGTILGGGGGDYEFNQAAGIGIYSQSATQVENSGEVAGGAGRSPSGGLDSHATTGGAGIFLAGGTISNSGTVAGGAGGASPSGGAGRGGDGVYLAGGGEILNLGVIKGGAGGDPTSPVGGYGVWLQAGGEVVNGSPTDHAAVLAGYDAMSGFGVVSVVNFGTIESTRSVAGSGTAFSVLLRSAKERLVLEPGSTTGFAQGDYATVEVAGGVGVIDHLGLYGGVLSGDIVARLSQFDQYVVDAGAAWTLLGSNLLRSGQTLANAGSLAIATGTMVTLQGVVANAGQISLDGAAAATDLVVGKSGLSLSGGGKVAMNGGKSRIYGTAKTATLTNVSDTIVGAGYLGLSDMTLDNRAAGVIDATGDLVLGTTGERIQNAGLLEATAGTLSLVSSTIANAGTIQGAGAFVDLQNSDVLGGSLKTTGVGQIVVNLGASTLDGSGNHPIRLAGEVLALDGTALTIVGAIINTGAIIIGGTAYHTTLSLAAGSAILSGGGQVELSPKTVNQIDASSAATLTNVDNHITGAGTIGNANLTLINGAKGFIASNAADALILNTGSHTIANAGSIEGGNGSGGLTIQSAVDNTGRLIAYHGALTVDGAVTGSGTATLAGGVLTFASSFDENVTFGAGASTLALARSQTYAGTISGFSKTGSTRLDLRDIAFKSAGEATFSAGVLTVTDGTHVAHIHLAGTFTGSTFIASSDGHGGTIVVDPDRGANARALAHFASAAAGLAAKSGASSQPTRSVNAETAALILPGRGHVALA